MPTRVLCVPAPGRLEFATEPDEPLAEGRFRVATVFSGLSAGTELTFLRGTNPSVRAGWDATLGLFTGEPTEAAYPVRKLGYMQVGRVVETRTPAIGTGRLVAMAYGHRTGYVADPRADRFVPLPDDIDPVLGIYAAHMGPICANGLLHAAADVCGPDVRGLGDGVAGRRVVVVGAGVVGVLTALFAREHGAAEVVVLDETRARLELCRALGLDAFDTGGAADAGRAFKERWRHGPADHGADVVFQCRGRSEALATALRVLRPQGTVVDLAFYTDTAAAVCLGEEFHHNGLAIRCAQIGRVPRGMSHLWDRERLSVETLALLRSRGTDIREHLVTDVLPMEEAPRLMAEVADRRRHVVQAVFTV
ncbi:threonine dehydrogenase-like Zn-dependent dehydrogenase [Spinactinospora alkalitolerans]|uniref:Threonine dehydrogenase-like Zn-dependent dehydrogenase n=1 Tax=Spinactinospora alkalitolerans TaxID=687207 RepID=A0A852TUE1_9ACTN|nr:zinc-binding alcohol dehydrogenase [Spinactinospora alkalitolerans]NYE47281.1 threonine dehydrogenase-like Zn-dependent dehydrogenase [Spinactinospora alkalitolerans]